MAKQMPTHPGDVLILRTEQSFHAYVVGPVCKDGQQDFQHQEEPRYAANLDDAFAVARGLLVIGGRIFLLDIDTGEWSDVSERLNPELRERKTA